MTLQPDRYELLTFDCYGTLIDWETGLADALDRVARAHGIEAEREHLLALFAQAEHPIQSG
ncbi:MAG: haloacid dehalogenase type II, partial [Gemmatimonadetes bacterium]|nr:haloacid dehalogenase type II [Gemmatimonadota bacterium]